MIDDAPWDDTWPGRTELQQLVTGTVHAAVFNQDDGVERGLNALVDLGGARAMYAASYAWAHLLLDAAGIDDVNRDDPGGVWGFDISVHDTAGNAGPVHLQPEDPHVPPGQAAALRFVVAIANDDDDMAAAVFLSVDQPEQVAGFACTLLGMTAGAIQRRMMLA